MTLNLWISIQLKSLSNPIQNYLLLFILQYPSYKSKLIKWNLIFVSSILYSSDDSSNRISILLESSYMSSVIHEVIKVN